MRVSFAFVFPLFSPACRKGLRRWKASQSGRVYTKPGVAPFRHGRYIRSSRSIQAFRFPHSFPLELVTYFTEFVRPGRSGHRPATSEKLAIALEPARRFLNIRHCADARRHDSYERSIPDPNLGRQRAHHVGWLYIHSIWFLWRRAMSTLQKTDNGNLIRELTV